MGVPWAQKVADRLRGIQHIETEEELLEAFGGEMPDNGYTPELLKHISEGGVTRLTKHEIWFMERTHW